MAQVSGIWIFNDVINTLPTTNTYNVNFISNSTSYIGILMLANRLCYKKSNINTPIYYFNDNTWVNEEGKTIDFGENKQEVDTTFYSWLVANATPQSGEYVIEIKYGNYTLGRLNKGQKATLNCSEQKMLYDVSVSFGEAGTITYDGKTKSVGANKVATLTCADKKMLSDVIIYAQSEVVGNVAGLYDVNGNIVATWEDLENEGMNVTKAYNSSTYLTDQASPYNVLSIYVDGKKLVIADSVTSIGNYAFYYCSSLTSVVIPYSIKSIGSYSFRYCSSLTSITIGTSVESISEYAFADCSSLTNVIIPDSVTTILTSIFRNCTNLKSVTIPNSIKSIINYMFDGCQQLNNVTIPNSVTQIYTRAFRNCISLTDIIIPNSVGTINAEAFIGCSSLKSVTIKATTPPTLSSATIFPTSNKGFTIYVPKGYGDVYKNYSTNWSNLSNYIQEED